MKYLVNVIITSPGHSFQLLFENANRTFSQRLRRTLPGNDDLRHRVVGRNQNVIGVEADFLKQLDRLDYRGHSRRRDVNQSVIVHL